MRVEGHLVFRVGGSREVVGKLAPVARPPRACRAERERENLVVIEGSLDAPGFHQLSELDKMASLTASM